MSDYRRFIAYVYEYQKSKKQANCGFIKVEVREQRCTIEVHLHCPGISVDVPCAVYGFIRKDGLINGIRLADCETEADTVECLIETDAHNMNESGFSLGKMGGMILITQTGLFFGTEWDDQNIRPDNFRELPISSPASRHPVSNTSDTPISSGSETSGTSVLPASETSGIPDQSDSEASGIPVRPGSETSGISVEPDPEISSFLSGAESALRKQSTDSAVSETLSSVTESPTASNSSFTDSAENSAVNKSQSIFENNPEYNRNHTTDELLTKASELPSNQSADSPDSVPKTQGTNASPEIHNNPNTPVSAEQSSNSHTESVSDISADKSAADFSKTSTDSGSSGLPFGEEFYPFNDGEIASAWKIQPRDFLYFPAQSNALRNNRFLQYGFYNFGHLLLGLRSNGQYIIGVPGGYNQQERFMANMFGFPYFKESTYIQLPGIRGGYWYRLINAPNLNHSHRLQ